MSGDDKISYINGDSTQLDTEQMSDIMAESEQSGEPAVMVHYHEGRLLFKSCNVSRAEAVWMLMDGIDHVRALRD